jgi:hypothetical protein
MRDCEVRYERLSPEHKQLFTKAKTKEVSSFLKQEAVRKCKDKFEEKEAEESGRIMKCRWVLTWKPIPEEEQAEERAKAQESNSTTTKDGKRKAKARIVLLGYQHPDLLKENFNSSAPVQSVLTRNIYDLHDGSPEWLGAGGSRPLHSFPADGSQGRDAHLDVWRAGAAPGPWHQ